MISNTRETVNRVFGIRDDEKKASEYRKKVNNAYGIKEYNPFLDKDGNIFNPYINYQKVLDNPNVAGKAKEYITKATGLTAAPQINTVFNKVNENSTQLQNRYVGGIGFISAKYESGGNGGTISPDTGGLSYGVSQFNTGSGSADGYVSWLKNKNPQMASMFGTSKAGSTEFSDAWTKTFQAYGDDFTNTQRQYTYEYFVTPLINLAKQKTGVDYSRSPALRELVYSTAVQFGGGNLGLSALGDVNTGMSDTDIINASYDKKIANYKSYFKSSTPDVQEGVKKRFANERNDVLALVGTSSTMQSNSSEKYSKMVGKKVADVSKYNNSAKKGQCVWYVRGRAQEKLGKTVGPHGDGNEMYYNARPDAKLAATKENIKPNLIVSYGKGTSSDGQKYGHVIYIEDVVGDTVYYTEGGSYYYNNGTIGTVKTATRQGILDGVNTNGGRMGSNVIGFIDVSKY